MTPEGVTLFRSNFFSWKHCTEFGSVKLSPHLKDCKGDIQSNLPLIHHRSLGAGGLAPTVPLFFFQDLPETDRPPFNRNQLRPSLFLAPVMPSNGASYRSPQSPNVPRSLVQSRTHPSTGINSQNLKQVSKGAGISKSSIAQASQQASHVPPYIGLHLKIHLNFKRLFV